MLEKKGKAWKVRNFFFQLVGSFGSVLLLVGSGEALPYLPPVCMSLLQFIASPIVGPEHLHVSET